MQKKNLNYGETVSRHVQHVISLVLTIRSYCRNYTDMKPVVFLSYGLKASLRTEHSMLKLKMLNQPTYYLMWCTSGFSSGFTFVSDIRK